MLDRIDERLARGASPSASKPLVPQKFPYVTVADVWARQGARPLATLDVGQRRPADKMPSKPCGGWLPGSTGHLRTWRAPAPRNVRGDRVVDIPDGYARPASRAVHGAGSIEFEKRDVEPTCPADRLCAELA